MKESFKINLRELYEKGDYEAVIREVDRRFDYDTDRLGDNIFTKEDAEWCLNQVSEADKEKEVKGI